MNQDNLITMEGKRNKGIRALVLNGPTATSHLAIQERHSSLQIKQFRKQGGCSRTGYAFALLIGAVSYQRELLIIPEHAAAKQEVGRGGSRTVAEGGAPSIKMHVQGDFRAIPPRQHTHVRRSGRVQEVAHKPDFVLGRHGQVLSVCRTFRGIVELGLEAGHKKECRIPNACDVASHTPNFKRGRRYKLMQLQGPSELLKPRGVKRMYARFQLKSLGGLVRVYKN